MSSIWKVAVTEALDRYSLRHATVQIDRKKLLAEEQAQIVLRVRSIGKTPGQTISRILQELRDAKFLYFSDAGRYVLNNYPLDMAAEDAPVDVVENAVANGKLVLRDVDASDEIGKSRIRQGVAALRRATLANYRHTCALCDIQEKALLVTSHVARWADRPEARGVLSNTICFYSFHDRLFENGYFALDKHCKVIRRGGIKSISILTWLDACTQEFQTPLISPSQLFLQEHRIRTGVM